MKNAILIKWIFASTGIAIKAGAVIILKVTFHTESANCIMICICNKELETENKRLKLELKEATARIVSYSNSYRAIKKRLINAQRLINGLRDINNGVPDAFGKHYGKK